MVSAALRFARRNAKNLALSVTPLAIALVLIAVPVLAVTNQAGQLNVTATTDPYAIYASNKNTAANSTGIFGVTYASGSKAIYGYSAASSGAPSFGVAGISQNGYGLYGSSYSAGVTGIFGENIGTGGTAIQGNSSSGNGIAAVGGANGMVGATNTTLTGFSGVLGQDKSNNESNFGVAGTTTYGYGTVGMATGSGSGGMFTAVGSPALIGSANSGTGILAESNTGSAIDATTNGTLAVLVQGGGTGADVSGSTIGIVGRAPAGTGTFPLKLTNSSGTVVYSVDGNGDVAYAGNLTSFVATRAGNVAAAYAPKTTTPTLEDVGTGKLVGGSATVKLDAAFAQSLDRSATYHVFITPNGDTRGVYVTSKTADGFVVRENQGGRDTVDFDYRIVGTTNGSSNLHMQAMSKAAASALAPRLAIPLHRSSAALRSRTLLQPNQGEVIRTSPFAVQQRFR